MTNISKTSDGVGDLREFCNLLESELAHLHHMAKNELEIDQHCLQWHTVLEAAVQQLEFVRSPITGSIRNYGPDRWCAFLGSKLLGNFFTEESAKNHLQMVEGTRRQRRAAAIDRRMEAVKEEFDFDALRTSLTRVQETYQGRIEVIQRILEHPVMRESS